MLQEAMAFLGDFRERIPEARQWLMDHHGVDRLYAIPEDQRLQVLKDMRAHMESTR